MTSLAYYQQKYLNFKTLIHRKLKWKEAQNFCDIVTTGYTSIQISVHADIHRQENSHGSYIIDEIADRFDYIVQAVLRCLLIA